MRVLISQVQTAVVAAFVFCIVIAPLVAKERPCERHGQITPTGKPQVAGKPYVVQGLRLRFSDLETGSPVTPKTIRLFLRWSPYEYDEKEGRHVSHYEVVVCYPSGDEFVMPSYEVRPWAREKYPGWIWPWGKPSLDGLELGILFDSYTYTSFIPRRKLKRFQGKTLHVKFGPKQGLAKYFLEGSDGSALIVDRYGVKFTSAEEKHARKTRLQQSAFIPPATSLELEADCKRAGESTEATKGETLVKGKSYVVPELRLRFSDLKTGDGITPKKVGLGYVWKDPVMLLESEDFNCYPGGETFVIPSFKVRPRTWEQYRGSSLPWNKPKFVWFQMAFYDDRMKGPALLQIPRHDIKQFRDKTLHVKIPLDELPHKMLGLTEFWLEASDGSMSRVEVGINELIFTPVSPDSRESTPKHKN